MVLYNNVSFPLNLLQGDDGDGDGGSDPEEGEQETIEDDLAEENVAVAVNRVQGDKRRRNAPPSVAAKKLKVAPVAAPVATKKMQGKVLPKRTLKPQPQPQPEPEPEIEETTHAAVSTAGKGEEGTETKKNGKKFVPWNDKNVDLDLNRDSANNVVQRRIVLSRTCIVSCKMISQTEAKALFSDYAALLFQKRTSNGGTYDFTLDLKLAERLIEALQHIIAANPRFFNKA